ncbi:MAG: hypothetical protein WCT03_03290 [Candidatus Obscuribacterales bacterium]|jgi:hypothetical protein
MPDVFISYGHLDNTVRDRDIGLWMNDFHQNLASSIGTYLGEAPEIFRDTSIGGLHILADTIPAKLSQTLIFLVVSTPRWHKSDWCRKELEMFLDMHGNPPVIKNTTKQRILKVCKTPYPRNKQHEAIAKLSVDYKFYDKDEFTEKFHEFDRAGRDHEKYFRLIEEVAQEIANALEELKS